MTVLMMSRRWGAGDALSRTCTSILMGSIRATVTPLLSDLASGFTGGWSRGSTAPTRECGCDAPVGDGQ
jgi:hypothetical protein